MLSVKIPDARPVVKKYRRDLETLAMRTVNEVAKKAKKVLARDVATTHGFTVGTINRRLGIKRAERNNPTALLKVSGRRLHYPGLRAVKRKGQIAGISFLTQMKEERKKMVDPVERHGQLGSKPFFIRGKNSGKRVPVYVAPAFLNTKRKRTKGQSHPRKVLTIYGSSLPHLIRKDWREFVRDYCIRIMPQELDRQKRRLDYLKSRR